MGENADAKILIADNESVVYEHGACIYLGYFNTLLCSLSGFIFLRFPGNLQQPEDYEEEFYRNKLDNELTFDKRLFEKDAYGTMKPYNAPKLNNFEENFSRAKPKTVNRSASRARSSRTTSTVRIGTRVDDF